MAPPDHDPALGCWLSAGPLPRLAGGGLQELEVLEVLAEEASVAGQQNICFGLRVSANEEVRDDSKPRPLAGRVVSAPESSSQPRSFTGERREREAEVPHRIVELRVVLEVSADFGPDDITGNQCSPVKSCAKRFA